MEMVEAFPIKVVAVIDALDECLVDRAALLDRLCFYIAETRGNIQFFLTSRDYTDTTSKLGVHDDIVSHGMIVEASIEKFVTQRVEQLPRLDTFKAQIIAEVPKASAGMFRYAALLLDELNSPLASTADISDMLKAPPRDLEEMYEHILLRLDSTNDKGQTRENRRKILYWVMMAKSPLNVMELAYVCAVRDDEKGFDPSRKALATEQDILGLCSPLIEFVNGEAQFTHLSAREFLRQKREGVKLKETRIDYYLVEEREANASIAITCSK
jgi:hypothetical protein